MRLGQGHLEWQQEATNSNRGQQAVLLEFSFTVFRFPSRKELEYE